MYSISFFYKLCTYNVTVNNPKFMFYVELVSILGKYLVDVLAKYIVQYVSRSK